MDTKEKVEKLRKEICDHYEKIDECSKKISELCLKDAGDFTGQYVVITTMENFVYMRVDQQDFAPQTTNLVFYGPAIILDEDPFDEDFCDEDLSSVRLEDRHTQYICVSYVREGELHKITKERFDSVFQLAINAIRKNMSD